MADVMVVISKLYDLIVWMTPITDRFPRSLRFTVADRLANELLDALKILIQARYSKDRGALLEQANLRLEYVRHLFRLAKDLKAMSIGQYEHGSRLVDEVGRLVGGWRKAARQPGSRATTRHPKERLPCETGRRSLR